MAVDLSSLSTALATIFDDRVHSQFNRSVPLLQMLPYEAGRSQNITWDVERGDGQQSSSTISDGTDVSTYNNDTIVPAVLQWGTYSEAFAITGKALSAAMGTGNPAELASLLALKMDRAITRLTQNIGKDIYSGSGSNSIIGMTVSGGALKATGTYAGVDRSSVTEWAGNELLNGGVARALSVQLMRDARRTIYVASGMAPDLIVCDPTQHEAYGQLLASNRRYNQDVFVRGQKITLDGGYGALDFDGIPVLADKNAPAGQMLFLNTRELKMRQLVDVVASAGLPGEQGRGGMVRLHGTAEEQLGQAMTSLSARINALAVTGDSFKIQLVLYPQLQCTRPNACAILGDLQ